MATLLVGVRDQVQGQPDDFLARPDGAGAGWPRSPTPGSSNELVVRRRSCPPVAARRGRVARSTFVLDHLGKPRSPPAAWSQWRALIRPVAALPNVVAKLSGLVTEADLATWTVRPRPFVATAVDLFGPARLMFGSDWPVCELVASYVEVKDALVACLGGTPEDIFAGTAVSTYRLPLTR